METLNQTAQTCHSRLSILDRVLGNMAYLCVIHLFFIHLCDNLQKRPYDVFRYKHDQVMNISPERKAKE